MAIKTISYAARKYLDPRYFDVSEISKKLNQAQCFRDEWEIRL